jgi:hypothetical protein
MPGFMPGIHVFAALRDLGCGLQPADALGEIAGPPALRLVGDDFAGEGFGRLLHAAAHRRMQRGEREDVALGVRAAETLGDAADRCDIFCTALSAAIGSPR